MSVNSRHFTTTLNLCQTTSLPICIISGWSVKSCNILNFTYGHTIALNTPELFDNHQLIT